LPTAPTNSSRQISVTVACGNCGASGRPPVIDGPGVRDQQQDAEREPEVADAVDDEGLLAGVGGGLLVEPEADQQVRTQAHGFPEDVQQQEVAREHEHQHREREEREVGEEARVAAVAVHVADRVEVHQKTHAGDHDEHDRGQRVGRELERHIERADLDPREQRDLPGGVLDGVPENQQRARE
jgi:hypothetical protein